MQERILASMSLSKMCAKIPSRRKSLHPARVFALAGMGPDGGNWQLAHKIRREGGTEAVRAWLSDDVAGTPTSMLQYEEQRLAALQLIEALNGRPLWIALDAVLSAQS